MTNTTLEEPAHPSPGARGRLAGLTNLRIEELARRERAAVRRRDWAAARDYAVERVELQEAHQRAGVRRWA